MRLIFNSTHAMGYDIPDMKTTRTTSFGFGDRRTISKTGMILDNSSLTLN
jgi:hypothetical protein